MMVLSVPVMGAETFLVSWTSDVKTPLLTVKHYHQATHNAPHPVAIIAIIAEQALSSQ
jgi:hypothetical protein